MLTRAVDDANTVFSKKKKQKRSSDGTFTGEMLPEQQRSSDGKFTRENLPKPAEEEREEQKSKAPKLVLRSMP